MPDPRILLREAAELRRAGRLDLAAQRARAAVQRRPPPPGAWRALGVILLEAGDLPGAAQALEEALRVEPAHAGLWTDLGTARLGAGLLAEAELALREALRLQPGLPPARLRLAQALRRLGRLEEAAVILAELEEGGAELWLERGRLELLRGRSEAALLALRQALVADPSSVEVALSLGRLLLREGRVLESAALLGAAARRSPEQPAVWAALCAALGQVDTLPGALEPLLAQVLERPELDAQPLLRPLLRRLPEELDALAAHRLLPLLLRRCVAADPGLEGRLVQLRRRLLDPGAGSLELREAFALQAHWNEQIWETTPEEQARLDQLEAGPLERPEELATLAMYRPLPPRALQRLARSTELPSLRRALVEQPATEARMAAALPCLALSDDPVSHAVAAMYEAHPYPRLVAVERPEPAELPTALRELLPHAPPWTAPRGRPLRVLIAGCGTGQQPLRTAARYPGAEVLAVDLSRASLGRAARLAAEWGLTNLRYAQADLLALEERPERFDLIECGGVLHHLADPLKGWRVLRGLLEPGGLMKVGLYSERGRAEIVALRQIAAERAWRGDSPADLRAARSLVMGLPEGHVGRLLLLSTDFYSQSGLRDLIFHPCEHRFGPLQLQAMMGELDLEFLGFQFPQPAVPRRYAQRYPEDPAMRRLELWEELEQDMPRAFSAMYQLWCRDGRAGE